MAAARGASSRARNVRISSRKARSPASRMKSRMKLARRGRPLCNAFDLALHERQVGVADRRQQVSRAANLRIVDAGAHELLAVTRCLRERAAERIEDPRTAPEREIAFAPHAIRHHDG